MSLEEQTEANERLDVREIDGEPFGDIVAALERLETDETLLLVNGFEPEPLYNVLAQRGFEDETANPGPDECHVEIRSA